MRRQAVPGDSTHARTVEQAKRHATAAHQMRHTGTHTALPLQPADSARQRRQSLLKCPQWRRTRKDCPTMPLQRLACGCPAHIGQGSAGGWVP